jgi:glycogen debranching enzyme
MDPHAAGGAPASADPPPSAATAPRGAEGEPEGVTIIEIDAPLAAHDIRDAALIKEGDLFLLSDLEGNVPGVNTNGFGLYYQDTRFLSRYELSIQGLRPTILLSSGRPHFLGAQVLTNPTLITREGHTIHEQTLQIRRYRMVRPVELTEALTFQNFNAFPITLNLSFNLEADFADIFEVRGIVRSDEHGRLLASMVQGEEILWEYEGRDGVRRSTRVHFDPRPDAISGGVVSYVLALPARGSKRFSISVRVQESRPGETGGIAVPRLPRPAPSGERQWLTGTTAVHTSNSLFDAILLQARSDLRLLLSGEGDLPFVAAGIPWYATLFGRDSLITALELLWLAPSVAALTLRLLARTQGERDDPWRDEEPGKIMHEIRRGELARLGVVPFTPYYGTIDATPLWIMLLAEYFRATGDRALVTELRPNLEAALTWIDRYGDSDGDGFVEYRTRSGSGLINQGWKDSTDGIVHVDGSIPEPPIALVEVQGYVYAARRGAAQIFRAFGDPERAAALEAQAEALRVAFDEAFWMPSRDFYAMALDGHKQQVGSISSNPGHALWCGLVPPARAERVVRRLMDEDLFSGWGIRTLSNHEVRYNPTGYHVGTVWPHDNALIALGCKRYRYEPRALELVGAMYEAAQHFPTYRMPELFCGFDRSAFNTPVRYPVACAPQAWAAAAWGSFLQVMLGIRANAPANELQIVRPRLPAWLQWVHVDRVGLGAGEVDLRYERIGDHTAVDVAAMRGDIRVTFVAEWGE